MVRWVILGSIRFTKDRLDSVSACLGKIGQYCNFDGELSYSKYICLNRKDEKPTFRVLRRKKKLNGTFFSDNLPIPGP